jgi:predicted transcriptional regulator
MELGDLELAVLKAVRNLREATAGEIYRSVREERGAAYTSVTTTIYRLVEKGLLDARRQSEKKVYYRLRGDEASRRAVGGLMDRLLQAFGPAAIVHLVQESDDLSEEDLRALREAIEDRRRRESGVHR